MERAENDYQVQISCCKLSIFGMSAVEVCQWTLKFFTFTWSIPVSLTGLPWDLQSVLHCTSLRGSYLKVDEDH